VTGAAGYLGSRLIAYLTQQPWVERIIAFDLLPTAADGRVISYQLNVRDSQAMRPILTEHGVTNFVHAAFVINRPPGWTTDQMLAANVYTANDAFKAAFSAGIEHLTFVSSVAVYGYQPGYETPLIETNPLHASMAYARYKVIIESNLFGLITRQYPQAKLAVARMAAVAGQVGSTRSPLAALQKPPVFIVINGGQARTQAIHEDDAASLLGAIVKQDAAGIFHGAPDDSSSWSEIGQLTGRRRLSMPRQVLRLIARLSPLLPGLHGLTPEIVDLLAYSLIVDNRATRERLHWAPQYTTRETFGQLFGPRP
jgi:nucleoside-diphosphate-sugar epimerase